MSETPDGLPAAESDEVLGAIVLANGGADKLADHGGVTHKALLELAGQTMIEQVLAAVQGCPLVGETVVACAAGGPVEAALAGRVELAPAEDQTFLGGIEAGFARLGGTSRALLVTCDMPLLTTAAVTDFIREVRRRPEADLVYSMVDIELTRQRFPEAHRTSVRLRDGNFTAAGLTAISSRFLQHGGPRLMAAFAARKSKVALGRLLGVSFLLRFALGLLSVEDIVRRAESLLDCRVAAVRLHHPECGFDVDTEEDLKAAQIALERQ